MFFLTNNHSVALKKRWLTLKIEQIFCPDSQSECRPGGQLRAATPTRDVAGRGQTDLTFAKDWRTIFSGSFPLLLCAESRPKHFCEAVCKLDHVYDGKGQQNISRALAAILHIPVCPRPTAPQRPTTTSHLALQNSYRQLCPCIQPNYQNQILSQTKYHEGRLRNAFSGFNTRLQEQRT